MGKQGMIVELSEFEFALACYAGQLIHMLSEHRGYTERRINQKISPVRMNQIGQLGEMVVAKCLGLYWGGGSFTFAKADLAHNIEVRTISRASLGLKVRPRDVATKRVVGVLLPEDLKTRQFDVVGWKPASEAKDDRWLCNPYGKGPVYYVPLDELRPIEELQYLIEEGL